MPSGSPSFLGGVPAVSGKSARKGGDSAGSQLKIYARTPGSYRRLARRARKRGGKTSALQDMPQFAGFTARTRVWIHLAFSELRQPNVSLLFLLKALMQHLLIMAQVELASQSRHGAISCDLVMFELLGRCDKPRIAKPVAIQHSEHHFSFIYKRLHGLVGM